MGTGKTKGVIGVRNLMTALMQTIPGKHLAMALRHCTAMLMCGKTIAHYLHKYRRRGGAPKAGTIVIIDEWSEVQLHLDRAGAVEAGGRHLHHRGRRRRPAKADF